MDKDRTKDSEKYDYYDTDIGKVYMSKLEYDTALLSLPTDNPGEVMGDKESLGIPPHLFDRGGGFCW